jgi:hypothetical protein
MTLNQEAAEELESGDDGFLKEKLERLKKSHDNATIPSPYYKATTVL